ncbi:hypothetical protein PR048_016775 [Dryococelus australis]|uniref:Uncharacterized protein n=1 Tax=Dryococelus australis TaxID=614101 RepID=A0ABQ9H7L0_9NEOP|nr:hypothetical protein PR048_016775 [Dryococelus australis]
MPTKALVEFAGGSFNPGALRHEPPLVKLVGSRLSQRMASFGGTKTSGGVCGILGIMYHGAVRHRASAWQGQVTSADEEKVALREVMTVTRATLVGLARGGVPRWQQQQPLSLQQSCHSTAFILAPQTLLQPFLPLFLSLARSLALYHNIFQCHFERDINTISTLAFHQGEPDSIPDEVTGFPQVVIVPDDAVGRRLRKIYSLHSLGDDQRLLKYRSGPSVGRLLVEAFWLSAITWTSVKRTADGMIARRRRTRCLWCERTRGRDIRRVKDTLLPVRGATVAERLACLPPTKAIRVQSVAGPLRIFARGNRAGRCRWSPGLLGDFPFPAPFHEIQLRSRGRAIDAIPQHVLARTFHNFSCRLHTCLLEVNDGHFQTTSRWRCRPFLARKCLLDSVLGYAYAPDNPPRELPAWSSSEKSEDSQGESSSDDVAARRLLCARLNPPPLPPSRRVDHAWCAFTCVQTAPRGVAVSPKRWSGSHQKKWLRWGRLNWIWSGAGLEGRRKREILEKTRRPTASSGTIPPCENPVIRPGIESGSPWWEASPSIQSNTYFLQKLPYFRTVQSIDPIDLAVSGRVTPGLSQVGIVPNDSRWFGGFPRGSPVPPLPYVPALLNSHLLSSSSALAIPVVKSSPNLMTQRMHGHSSTAVISVSDMHSCRYQTHLNLVQRKQQARIVSEAYGLRGCSIRLRAIPVFMSTGSRRCALRRPRWQVRGTRRQRAGRFAEWRRRHIGYYKWTHSSASAPHRVRYSGVTDSRAGRLQVGEQETPGDGGRQPISCEDLRAWSTYHVVVGESRFLAQVVSYGKLRAANCEVWSRDQNSVHVKHPHLLTCRQSSPHACQSPRAFPPEIEPGSPLWEAKASSTLPENNWRMEINATPKFDLPPLLVETDIMLPENYPGTEQIKGRAAVDVRHLMTCFRILERRSFKKFKIHPPEALLVLGSTNFVDRSDAVDVPTRLVCVERAKKKLATAQ